MGGLLAVLSVLLVFLLRFKRRVMDYVKGCICNMFVAVFGIWLACVVVFLSSKQQTLLTTRVSKKFSWIFFSVLIVVSTHLFALQHTLIVSCLLTLANIMVIWIVLVFSQGYFAPNYRQYFVGGIAFAFLTNWLGGA